MSSVPIQVALDVPLFRLFSYSVDADTPCVGSRVVVPFGRRRMAGIVVGYDDGSSDAYQGEMRSILSLPEDMPPLSETILALYRFVATYYQHPLGQVIHCALPIPLRQPKAYRESTADVAYQAHDLERLLQYLSPRAKAQRAVAESLSKPQILSELRASNPAAGGWVRRWLQEGLVQVCTAPVDITPQVSLSLTKLNPEQQQAVDAIVQSQGFAPFLLFGVTGSGKTEVYLEAIAECVRSGRQALVLVPEINLTPQLVGRFAARFPGEKLACLHSGLADGERCRNWLAASRGEARIVLGTRLAVLTPIPRLGLLVVDEEHDTSYKQQEGLLYSARDVAVYRANQAQIAVVLGSATPSLESWSNMQQGRYQLLELTQRAVPGAVLPALQLLSMHRNRLEHGLHPTAIRSIKATLTRGEQALVFINRRGYAPVLHCPDCGWLAACPHCTARLVIHLQDGRLQCHHCGHESRIPEACPDCGSQNLQALGQGTQRLEASLQKLFPEHVVMRMDRDSLRRKGELDQALDAVRCGQVDILVGTQMLAKGHDFPNLSCVVVLNADTGLFSVDFRAEERLFALLMQVAGRAGRRQQQGEVLIQTEYQAHPFYQMLLGGDYRLFAETLLQDRQALALPPYTFWAVLRAEARDSELLMHFLNEARASIPVVAGVTVRPPLPAIMQRKAGFERAQVLFSAKQRGLLQKLLQFVMPQIEALAPRGIRWTIDVDPVDF